MSNENEETSKPEQLQRRLFTLLSVGGSVPPLKQKLTWEEMIAIAHEDAAQAVMEKSRQAQADWMDHP